ncbi:hypothetical protein B0H10DRAFT_736481 [Mycena sp. CBHHK59/15]|nr:hypothetical protein B0H10DRAFT_736481 [Mycena sp. CBHHK59/15]
MSASPSRTTRMPTDVPRTTCLQCVARGTGAPPNMRTAQRGRRRRLFSPRTRQVELNETAASSRCNSRGRATTVRYVPLVLLCPALSPNRPAELRALTRNSPWPTHTTVQRAPATTGDVRPPVDFVESAPGTAPFVLRPLCGDRDLAARRPVFVCCLAWTASRATLPSAASERPAGPSATICRARSPGRSRPRGRRLIHASPTRHASFPANAHGYHTCRRVLCSCTPSFLLRHGPSVAARRLPSYSHARPRLGCCARRLLPSPPGLCPSTRVVFSPSWHFRRVEEG